MNRLYPHTSPQVLTDKIFMDYGGCITTSTPVQRQMAYLLSEVWISEHINTPVVPSIITGSYYYPQHGGTIQLDWAYLQEIYEIRFKDSKGSTYHTITGTNNVHTAIRNKWRSVVDILTIYGNCQGCSNLFVPYEFEIIYRAGLPTGTYASGPTLWAFTELSTLVLNEVMGCGSNETPGLIGVTEFRNQEYAEKRTALLNTAFGSSPKAQLILKILSPIRKFMKVGL